MLENSERLAFGVAIQAVRPMLVNLARAHCSYAEPEDVVEDALLIAWNRLMTFEGAVTTENVGRWLAGYVKLQCRNQKYRRTYYQNLGEGEEAQTPLTILEEFDLPDLKSILTDVRLLTETEQAVLSMTAEGYTEREISAALCLPKTTVHYHLQRGCEKIRAFFEE